MIQQGFIIDLLSNKSQPAAGEKRRDSGFYTGAPSFKDILSVTMDKPAVKLSGRDNQRDMAPRAVMKDKQDYSSPEPKQVRYSSYRDAVNSESPSVKVESTGKADEISAVEETEAVPKEDKKEISEADMMVNGLAQVLGINPEDLMTLLGFLQIKPEDLTDPGKLPEIAGKLANLLGLNTEQTETLAGVMKIVNRQVKEMFQNGSIPQQPVESSGSGVVLTGVTSESSTEIAAGNGIPDKNQPGTAASAKGVYNDSVTAFKQLMEKLQVRLQELSVKYEQSPDGFEEFIMKQINSMMIPEQSAMPVNGTIQGTDGNSGIEAGNAETVEESLKPEAAKDPGSNTAGETAQTVETTVAVVKDSAGQGEANPGNKENTPEEGTLENASIASESIEQKADGPANKGETTQFNNVLAANQTQRNTEPAAVHKIHREVPVSREEVLSQVIEKAKVVLSHDKSEMVMELKPDHLGKLSLKVVTERGMVMAKISAESERVKEILESNMQLLKDSLKNRGYLYRM